VLRLLLRSVLICAAIQAGCLRCAADGAQRFETYVTGDYSNRAAALATSTVWSSFGPIDRPGFRLKVDGFASVYGETNANVFSSAFMAADLKTLSDVMAGYQFNWGNVWIKLYGGAAYQAHTPIFWGAGLAIRQVGYGAVASVESYWQGNNSRFWASANLSWLQFDNTASFYERVAYEAYRDEGLKLSIGVEAAAMIKNANVYREGRRLDLYNEYTREGALLNARYWSHDLTLSGGFSRASDDHAWRPYVTLSYGKKF